VQNIQVACDGCGSELIPEAAYCQRCGRRTRRAKRWVGIAIRVELLFLALVIVLIFAFTWIYYTQS